MKNWPDWYRELSLFRAAIYVFRQMRPSLALAGVICMLANLIVVMVNEPSNESLGVPAFILGCAIVSVIGAALTVGTGFLSICSICLIDDALGKMIRPTPLATLALVLATIPVSIFGAMLYSPYGRPSLEIFIGLHFLPTITIGCICGIWGARTHLLRHEF